MMFGRLREGNMNKSLLDGIHSTERRIATYSRYGNTPCKVALLDFVGAAGFFITDFGLIQDRSKILTNASGDIVKGYFPSVVLDHQYPYPWVELDTTGGPVWFPINQLMGWAFAPYAERKCKYFICDHPGVMPCSITHFTWSDKPYKDKEVKSLAPSRYLDFMKAIYE